MISIDYYSVEIPGLPLDSIISSVPLLITEEKHVLGDITLVFCTDNELLEINKKHLSHDFYTDIITFNFNAGKVVGGDLFISIDRVRDNANELQISFDEELHRVCYHGVLHLLGYNDKTSDEISKMRSKEDYYLTKLFHVKR